MGKFIDLARQKFGRLIVLSRTENNKDGKTCWNCKCDCGNTIITTGARLRRGVTKSCSCFQKEVGRNNKTHGHAGSKEYSTWCDIKKRCYNPNNSQYKYYGGRGIKVCDRWRDSFENFLADIGAAPTPQHSIDRIDNDGNYEPGNCRWATPLQQANNKRCNIMVGELSLANYCRENNLNYDAIYLRIRRSWSIEKAISTPIKSRKN